MRIFFSWFAFSILFSTLLLSCDARPKPNGKLLPIRLGDRFGFIDETGQKIVEPIYTDAGDVCEGLALVIENGEKFGFIDASTGREVIKPQFLSAWNFSENLAQVRIGKKYWLLG